MSLTILGVAQAFAYEINIPAPSTLLSLSSPADLQILNLIYSVSRDLRQSRCWIQQKKSYSLTLTAARVKYPLPLDWYSALLRTQWDTGKKQILNGPMVDSDFMSRLYGISGVQGRTAFRIWGPDTNPNSAGGQFYVDPPPSGGETITYEYISSNLFEPPNWTPSTVVPATSYRNANGKNYFTSAGGTTSTIAPNVTPFSDGTATWTEYTTPYETIISNNDFSIFDDEIMILGLKAKWYQMKGLAYEALQKEYEDKIDEAQARWEGSNIGSFNRYPRFIRRYGASTPGGWSF